MIKESKHGTLTITGAEDIGLFRLLALRSALGLEVKGMRINRHINAYMLAKREFGFRGNKQRVYEQLCSYIEEVREARALNAHPDTAQA